eukprot:11718770-Ditylum_brightwellii.AAC.1
MVSYDRTVTNVEEHESGDNLKAYGSANKKKEGETKREKNQQWKCVDQISRLQIRWSKARELC